MHTTFSDEYQRPCLVITTCDRNHGVVAEDIINRAKSVGAILNGKLVIKWDYHCPGLYGADYLDEKCHEVFGRYKCNKKTNLARYDKWREAFAQPQPQM
jgi:hypothetical protein